MSTLVSLNEDLDFVACIKIFTASIEDHALIFMYIWVEYEWTPIHIIVSSVAKAGIRHSLLLIPSSPLCLCLSSNLCKTVKPDILIYIATQLILETISVVHGHSNGSLDFIWVRLSWVPAGSTSFSAGCVFQSVLGFQTATMEVKATFQNSKI